MKFILPSFLLLLLSLPASAQVAVSGNVQDVGVANVTSGMQVTFELQNFGGAIPRVPGGPVIGRVLKSFNTDASGNFTGSLYPNSVIEPQGTWYRVCVVNLGQELRCNKYLINGPFVLSAATPITPSTNVGPNQFITESFPFTQLTPATTWTITHNFNDSGTIVFVKSTAGDQIFPDKVNCQTDRNSCVLTFVTPTAGSAIAMHAAAINIASNQPNAVVQNATAPQAIIQPLTLQGNLTATIGQNVLNAYNINGILTVEGQKYQTFAAALADCPAIGCTIDMRGNPSVTALNLGTVDPGAKSVTLLLGPFTYQIQQLVLETNFHVIGAGTGQYNTSFTSLTILQACSTCAATDTVVLGTNGGGGGPIQHALVEGLRIYGATADTAIGMNLKTVNGSGTGIWYSTFRNLCVGVCGPSGASANGFSGGAIALDATGTNTINQFLDFYNVQAFKTNGGSPALSILGTNGQMSFMQCEWDGTTRNDGATVVQIANSSGNQGPYSLTFNGNTVQHGTTGINIAGAFSITFIGTHFELVGQAISVNSGVGGDVSSGITFIGSTCQNFCGNNTGSGWFAKTTTPNAVSVTFIKNQIQSTVDSTYTGFTNIQNFVSIGDESTTATTTAPLANLFGQQIIYKTGSSGGDYTTTSTNYVQVDGTNLLASIFIPFGWKLVVAASGAINSNTAAAQVYTAIADGGTPVVVNTSLVSAAGNPTNFSLNTVISGNGATHSIDLRFKTANAADAANIVNNAGNGIPQMVFTLMPSN